MAIEHTGDDNAVSLRCKLLVGAVYTALGTLAIAAGVWGGSRFTTADQRKVIVYAHNVGGEAQLAMMASKMWLMAGQKPNTRFLFP